MIRRVATTLALMLVIAACGGDDDATTTTASDDNGQQATTTEAPPTTSGATAPGADDDFCLMLEPVFDAQVMAFDLSPEGLEESVTTALAAANEVADAAPGEIEDDVRLVLGGFEDLAGALDDIDYNPFANIDAFLADPRVQALDSPEYAAANDAINEYCGIEGGSTTGGGFSIPADTIPTDGSLPPDLISGDLPEGFNPDYVPPGATSTQTIDVGIGYQVTFTSSAAWEEVLEHYTTVLGQPFQLEEQAGINAANWFLADGTTVVISDTAGTLSITVAGPS